MYTYVLYTYNLNHFFCISYSNKNIFVLYISRYSNPLYRNAVYYTQSAIEYFLFAIALPLFPLSPQSEHKIYLTDTTS